MNEDQSEGHRSADGAEHSGHPDGMHEPQGHPQTHHTAPPASAANGSRGHEEHAGHDKRAGHSVAMFRQKFWGTLLLSIQRAALATSAAVTRRSRRESVLTAPGSVGPEGGMRDQASC